MRAAGMQVLTDQVKAKRPGCTIYGIGDKPHQETTSGHNEDDTPGVKAEDQDTDSKPEHRALDFMVAGPFTMADGNALVRDLTTDPENRLRIIYVNWGNYQYHRDNDFQPEWNGDDPHHDHVHASGEANQDENITPWNLSDWDGTDMDFNQSQQLKAIFNVWSEIELDTDATPDGVGGLQMFPVPLSQRFVALEKQVKLIADTVSKPVEVTLSATQLDLLAQKVATQVKSDVLRPMADAAQAEATTLNNAAGA